MKKHLFYHIYLTDDNSWIQLFVDQFSLIVNTGLSDELENIFVTAIGVNETLETLAIYLKIFSGIFDRDINLNWYNKNYNDEDLKTIMQAKNKANEVLSLKTMWDFCNQQSENHHILYVHSKGVASNKLNVKNNPNILVNNHFWRKFMEWAVIEKSNQCCEALLTHDTAGTNYSQWPAPHYSGNFWWANSEYIKTLADPSNDDWWLNYRVGFPEYIVDRVKAEMWIGSNNAKMFSLYNHSSPPPISNLAETLITRKEYCL